MSKKFKILFLSATPEDQMKLEVNDEFRAIQEKLDGEYFSLISVSRAQSSDLQALVLRNNPQIIHFSGHTSSDKVFFENSEKKSQAVGKEALINMFRHLYEKPEIVFFNSCRSADNLDSLSKIVNFVVATQRPVFDDVAINFAAGFYEYLSLGRSVKTAFELAKNQFNIRGAQHEAEMYKLYVRAGANDKIFVSTIEPDSGRVDVHIRDVYTNEFNIAGKIYKM